MLVWIVSISMGFLLLLIVVGTVMLIGGIAIGIQYQRRQGIPSVSQESSKNYDMDLKASHAAPLYEDVTVVGQTNGIELNDNVAYGHISLK